MTTLGVLCCIVVCLTLLASFFLPSFSSLIKTCIILYIYIYIICKNYIYMSLLALLIGGLCMHDHIHINIIISEYSSILYIGIAYYKYNYIYVTCTHAVDAY